MKLNFRSVQFEDSSTILIWRNLSESREASTQSEAISNDEHLKWFSSRIKRIDLEPYLIFFLDNIPVGTCRLDLNRENQNEFIVSIIVDPIYRKLGIGEIIFGLTYETYLSGSNKVIIANVLKSNLPSRRLFSKLGFEIDKISNNFIKYKKL